MSLIKYSVFLLIPFMVAPGFSYGMDLNRQSSISFQSAKTAAEAALTACKKNDYAVSVAVVDAAGQLLVLIRNEQAGPHSLDSSWRKAYTALTLRKPTQELAALVARKPEIQALGRMNEKILLLGGGIPIKVRDHVVGAIGVGGAPGAMLDVACAREGIKAIKD